MTISDYMYSAYEDEKMRKRVAHAIKEGMFPFDSGNFQLYTWYDIDYFRSTLKVVVERLPDHVFEYVIDHAKLVAYPDSFVDEFVYELFRHFRYRPAIPVEDHILLGES